MSTVVLLAAGEPPRHAVPRALFAAADVLVCCDGAYAAATARGREPDFTVGDGDSLPSAVRAALGARFIPAPDQDTNDLDKAFRFAAARWPSARFVILGATGRREDHALGNIFRLPAFAAVAPDVSLVTDAGVFTVAAGARTYPCRPGAAVSVFAPAPGTRVASDGLRWPLDGVALDALWRGTLNRAVGTSFTLRASAPVIVFTAHPAPLTPPGGAPAS